MIWFETSFKILFDVWTPISSYLILFIFIPGRRIELLWAYVHERIFKVFPPNFVSRLEFQITFILYSSIDARRKRIKSASRYSTLRNMYLRTNYIHTLKKPLNIFNFLWSNTLLSSSWILTLLSLLCCVRYKIYNNLKSTFINFPQFAICCTN